MYPCQNNEQTVTAVSRLRDQGAVVGRLAALHEAHNQPPCVEWLCAPWVLQRAQNAIRGVVDGLYGHGCPAAIDQKLLTQPRPVQPLLTVHTAEPLLVIPLALDHSQVRDLDESLIFAFALQ